jgi:hypothetical protein
MPYSSSSTALWQWSIGLICPAARSAMSPRRSCQPKRRYLIRSCDCRACRCPCSFRARSVSVASAGVEQRQRQVWNAHAGRRFDDLSRRCSVILWAFWPEPTPASQGRNTGSGTSQRRTPPVRPRFISTIASVSGSPGRTVTMPHPWQQSRRLEEALDRRVERGFEHSRTLHRPAAPLQPPFQLSREDYPWSFGCSIGKICHQDKPNYATERARCGGICAARATEVACRSPKIFNSQHCRGGSASVDGGRSCC